MLAWKWWRDVRGRALVYLGGALAFGLLASVDAAWFRGWIAWRSPEQYGFYLQLAWMQLGRSLYQPAWIGAMWMGLALAVSSFGRDYASPANTFLITRPRSRTAMLWMDWALSIALVMVTAVILVGTAIAGARFWIPQVANWSALAVVPPAVATAMVMYGLVLFWTAATANGTRGVEATIATVLVAWLAPGALLSWWHIAWPDRVQTWMAGIYDWTPLQSYWYEVIQGGTRSVTHRKFAGMTYHNPEVYPMAELAVWIGLGLALMYAAQKIVEHREV